MEFDTHDISNTLITQQDTGYTEVTYFDLNLDRIITQRGKAPSPVPATVTTSGNSVNVHIELSGRPGSNPLTPPGVTPPINYEYDIEFDLNLGRINIEATTDHFLFSTNNTLKKALFW